MQMHSTAAGAVAPFRLITDFERAYLKFCGREPATLEELAIARNDCERRRREAEIRSMRAKLALLDPFLPILAERGIRLADRNMVTLDGGKSIKVWPIICTKDDKLLSILLELGFREIERKSYVHDQEVTLKHGRSLVLRIEIAPAEPRS